MTMAVLRSRLALLAGSPAIDAGNPSNCPGTDQRGVARPFGAGCDIGAFESSPPYSIRGRVEGYLGSPGGDSISIGTQTMLLDQQGRFRLDGLTGAVTWSSRPGPMRSLC